MPLSRLLVWMERQLLEEEPQGAGTAPPLFTEVSVAPRSHPTVSWLKQTADKFIQIGNMWAPLSAFGLVSSQVGFPLSQGCL